MTGRTLASPNNTGPGFPLDEGFRTAPLTAHTPPLVQRLADFRGVQSPLLRDGTSLAGLMLSAAGAAGLTTTEAPLVRTLTRDGLAALLLLDAGHMAVHTFPDRELLVLDLLLPTGRDPQACVDVFARKFGVAEARSAGQRSFDRG